MLVQAGEISVAPDSRDPLRGVAAIRHAATTGLPLSAETLARLAQDPISTLRPAQRDVLVDARAGEHLADTYGALDVKGIVARAGPGRERLRNRPQCSAVHCFMVDRHQIETVLEAQCVLSRVSRPDLLLPAALLHDLGKHVDSRDHAADGAPLAEAAAVQLGCDEGDARLIAALVREHLALVDFVPDTIPRTPQRSAQEAVLSAVQRSDSAQMIHPALLDDEPISLLCLGAPAGAGVFAAMARVLVRLRLDVHSAVVRTQSGVAVNTWCVTGTRTDLLHPSVMRTALDRELAHRDRADARVLELPSAPPPRSTEDTPVLTLLLGASREATVVQVNARNRPSLLADVAEAITLHGLQVRSALVTTLGRRA